MKRIALCLLPLVLVANSEGEPEPAETETSSEFVGRYDGGSFETAMGMEIHGDGTFGWGVSVGALDMRARGTWRQEGNFIYLTSDPKPVEPEFKWSGLESTGATPEDTPFLRVVWGTNGKEFQYADAELTCENGERFYDQVHRDGYPSIEALEYTDPLPPDQDPRQSCDVPDTVVLVQSIHRIRSKPFKLADLGWEAGQTVRFAFHPNDMGVADFTGVTGYLEDGMLKLVGAEWPLEMRKLPSE